LSWSSGDIKMDVIIVSWKVLNEIKNDLDSSSPKKIAAIKRLRSATQIDLRTAKYAIERLQQEEFGGTYPQAMIEGKKLITSPLVKKIVVDMGDGEIEVDLEGLQMRALSDLQAIGLEACGRILDLVDILQAFSRGEKVQVAEVEDLV
jgi:hypothetical protein